MARGHGEHELHTQREMHMTSLDGARILVTGAGGFIGSHLVEALVRIGCRVTALLHYDSRSDKANLEFLPREVLARIDVRSGDINDPFFLLHLVEGHDVVFHLAALIPIPYSYVAPASYVTSNVQGTLNVCEAARRAKVTRVVHTSTSETYGTAQSRSIDEDHPLQAQSPYAASKIGADKIAESYFRAMDLPVSIIRPFNTFGPRQSARAIIPTILTQLLSAVADDGRSGPARLRVGALDPVRDFTYVEDTVAGFIAVAQSEQCIGKVTNVGFGRGVTIRELAAIAMQVVGLQAEVVSDERRLRPPNSEVMALICNREAARQRCGWEPRVSLEEGIRRTAEFIRARLSFYRPEEYTT